MLNELVRRGRALHLIHLLGRVIRSLAVSFESAGRLNQDRDENRPAYVGERILNRLQGSKLETNSKSLLISVGAMSNELEYDCDTLMAKSHLSDSEMAYLLREFSDLKGNRFLLCSSQAPNAG